MFQIVLEDSESFPKLFQRFQWVVATTLGILFHELDVDVKFTEHGAMEKHVPLEIIVNCETETKSFCHRSLFQNCFDKSQQSSQSIMIFLLNFYWFSPKNLSLLSLPRVFAPTHCFKAVSPRVFATTHCFKAVSAKVFAPAHCFKTVSPRANSRPNQSWFSC